MSSTPELPDQATSQPSPDQEAPIAPAPPSCYRTGSEPFNDDVMRRLLHDLDVANDWHAEP